MASERRLIDVDEWRHETCVWCNEHDPDGPCEPSDCPAMQYINNFPTVDAVEVVRCKDCKDHNRCEVEDLLVYFDPTVEHYCCHGERKDNE